MDDLPPGRGSNDDTGDDTPRWVKVFWIIVIVVVLLLVVLLLGGGEHGPGRHSSSVGGPGGRTPPSGVTEHGVRQP